MGVDFLEGPVKEVVLVSPSGTKALGPFLDVLARTFVPNRVLAACDGRSRADDEALVPLVAEKTAIDGKTTAYVCEHRTCRLPTTDPEELARQLSIRSTPAS
jgi:uncharacterized protein YyaL (SSP411 family)